MAIPLLEQVRVAAPRVVRILMTAATDVDPIVTCASVAHRFLAKPFEGEELEQLIECASLLRDIPIPSALAEVIGSVVKGPLFPVHYGELIDPLYCVTRSPDLRPARVLAARLFEQLRVPSAIDPNPLWALGCESAEWALHICECERLSARMRAHAVVASLLHPLGAMLVARYGPESGCADDEAHLKDPELHHASVASYTLALWGFPNEVVEAVAFHLIPDRNQPSVLGAITVTHAACAIACSLRQGDSPTLAVDLQHLERLGLKRRLVSWLETRPH